jgi:hypothetical protein
MCLPLLQAYFRPANPLKDTRVLIQATFTEKHVRMHPTPPLSSDHQPNTNDRGPGQAPTVTPRFLVTGGHWRLLAAVGGRSDSKLETGEEPVALCTKPKCMDHG